MESEEARLELVSAVAGQSHGFVSDTSKGGDKAAKLEMLKAFYSKIFSALLLHTREVEEPVVIMSNSEFNIFPLLQTMMAKDYKISAERFWYIARNCSDPSRETWRPRIQKCQVKSLSDTRYPSTEEEWLSLERVLTECSDGLLSGLTPEHSVTNIKEFVANVRRVWKGQRRRGHKRAASNGEATQVQGASGRVVADFHVMQDTGDLQAHENIQEVQKTRAPGTRPSIHSSSSSEARALQDKVTPATLLVGGKEFATTLATLTTVPESFFSKLIMASAGAHDFFIDRSGEVFEDVLRYLRAKRYGECIETLPLTNHRHGLELLQREASFYNLPELALIAKQRLKKKPPSLHVVCLETPVVAESDLAKEINTMNDKANAVVDTKMEELSDIASVRILSHSIVVETDVKDQDKKRAKLVMTLESTENT